MSAGSMAIRTPANGSAEGVAIRLVDSAVGAGKGGGEINEEISLENRELVSGVGEGALWESTCGVVVGDVVSGEASG